MNSILIIDDENEILWSLKQLFQEEFKIHTALNAEKGFELLAQNDIHLIISDQWMPGMTGIEFLEKVKELYPDTIRILLTGYADIDVVMHAINRGHVYKYLTKPWNPELIRVEINDACKLYNLIKKNKNLTRELQKYTSTLKDKVETRTAQLKTSKERYQALIESIPDWIWELDAGFCFTFCSQQSTQIIGYEPKELLAKNPFEFLFAPEQAVEFKKMLSNAPSESQNIGHWLLEMDNKQGQARYLESNVKIIRNPAGEISGYIGISRDVTEKRQAEQALIQHEKELSLLLDASNYITTLHDQQHLMESILNGAILAVNSDCGCLCLFHEETQSFSLDATVGFSSATLKRAQEKLSNIQLGTQMGMIGIVGETRSILSMDNVQKDPRWLNIDPAIQSAMWLPIIYEEQLLGVLNLFRFRKECFSRANIRVGKLFANKVAIALENRRLYNQIQQSETSYRLLVENANDVVVRLEASGYFSFVNSRFLQLTGYSDEAAAKLHISQLFHPQSFDRVNDYQARKLAGEKVSDNYELRIITQQGETLDVDATFTPIRENRTITAFQGIIRNITEKKRTEAAIRSYEEKLRLILENLTEIIYSINEKGAITFISPTIEKLTHIEVNQFLGRTIWESFAEFVPNNEIFEKKQAKHKQALAQKKPTITFELELNQNNSETRTIEFSENINYQPDGSVAVVNGVIHEITERKQAEKNLRQTLDGIIQAISLMIQHRDPYTAGHQRNTAKLAAAIARQLKLDESRIEGLGLAAILLDVGKLSIPAEILNKTSFLSEAEMSIIRTHVTLGADILKKVPWPWDIVRFVREHHERMDGSGYPNGLRGDEICLEARILAIADAIDAMINHRPYRPALNIDEVIQKIVPTQLEKFDSNVINAIYHLYENDFFISLSNNMFKITL